jgi:GNAT superfamily N-acetyltransferase
MIIQANLSHLEELVPLFDAYRQFYEQASDVEGARQFLAARMSRNESVIFLAYHEGEAVGFTQLYPSFSSVSMQRLWILNDLFVAANARKHGVASALMRYAEQFSRDEQAKGLTLQTAVDNIPAQSLYEKRDWVRETDFYDYFFKT